MLNPSSKIKGEKDWQKYEVARRLKRVVEEIRSQYRTDWKSPEMKKRQRGVALYFIDKLALRTGNEKEEGRTADTVGCCSLRMEHVRLHMYANGHKHVVELDFLGKDSIRYYNWVPVEKAVFQNLQIFMENKDPGEDLFDKLTTSSLNKHLQDLMDGLTAKVFRTYNASIVLQEQLRVLTRAEDSIAAKILAYNRANRAVAILCNHQRATPKTFEKSMRNLQTKIQAKKTQIAEAQGELRKAEGDYRIKGDGKSKSILEKKQRLLQKLEEQLVHLSTKATDKEENQQVALGTSKLSYLDPRISIAWRWELRRKACRTAHSGRASPPCECAGAGRIRPVRAGATTRAAFVGPLFCVDASVLTEERAPAKGAATIPAGEGPLTRCAHAGAAGGCALTEGLAALLAFEWVLCMVRSAVPCDVGVVDKGPAVVAARVWSLAKLGGFSTRSAFVGPFACVKSLVPDQIEAVAEGLATFLARIGSLPSVTPLVQDHVALWMKAFPRSLH
ncbi:DNA topoisomerase I, mitochondrial isoform X1 [Octodon degus]|uniref:DNA topoisomerase I n=1 Tax=Octodon degus TaxID=10160 RepID=A0A6P6F663_OCTDE|nr:DNA topoisomerase I, mitochondrial isoform X1 [Octodon degus]